MTSKGPAWVEFRKGKFRLIPSRALAVKRIFELAASGYGVTRIVQTLLEEGIPAFGERKVTEGRSRSQFAGYWTRPYVRLILNDRRAVGEFQPRTINRKAEGAPIPNFYPAAVTEQEFLLARVEQHKRKNHDKHAVPRDSRYVNVFKGLLRNAEDGEGFLLHNKGTSAKPELLLVNSKGNGGRGRTITFPYRHFEREILSRLREIDQSELNPERVRTPNRLDMLKAELKDAREQVEQLTADLAKGYSAAISKVLREQEDRAARIKQELAEEEAKLARPVEKDWQEFRNLAETIASSPDPEDTRLRLRCVLGRTVEGVWVRIVKVGVVQLCGVQVWFADDPPHRSYLIRYRPAANGRKEQIESRSVLDDTALDLRNLEHAERLAESLITLEGSR
jgi:hypothetical protein